MRAFIALELRKNIQEELVCLQRKLQSVNPDVKWIESESIHLTLKFLGDIEDANVEQINNILKDVSKEYKSFEINLFKIGAFPKIDYPKVIWVGVDKNCNIVDELAKKIDDKLYEIGFLKEDKPFSAHITIGRVKSLKNKDKLKDLMLSCDVKQLPCLIDRIVLYKSQLTPEGAIYTKVFEVMLS